MKKRNVYKHYTRSTEMMYMTTNGFKLLTYEADTMATGKVFIFRKNFKQILMKLKAKCFGKFPFLIQLPLLYTFYNIS